MQQQAGEKGATEAKGTPRHEGRDREARGTEGDTERKRENTSRARKEELKQLPTDGRASTARRAGNCYSAHGQKWRVHIVPKGERRLARPGASIHTCTCVCRANDEQEREASGRRRRQKKLLRDEARGEERRGGGDAYGVGTHTTAMSAISHQLEEDFRIPL